jgi:hypothetical protein
VPSVQELGPLPMGLAIRGEGGDAECGTGRCAVSYALVGRAGESADQVTRRMWDHLVSKGWPAPDGGRSCRPVGWLLDTRETCVAISTAEGVPRLTLEGGRLDPRSAGRRPETDTARRTGTTAAVELHDPDAMSGRWRVADAEQLLDVVPTLAVLKEIGLVRVSRP